MKEDRLRELLKARGCVFERVVNFKKSDRIRWHTNDLTISLNLGKKLEDLTEKEFIDWVVP